MRSLNDSTDVTRLFAPTQLGHLELRNSFVMAPMTRSRSPQSTPTAEVAEYYRRRAAGGVALLITEGVLVDHISPGHHNRSQAGLQDSGRLERSGRCGTS